MNKEQRTKYKGLKKAKMGRGAQRGDFVRVRERKMERVIARMSGE